MTFYLRTYDVITHMRTTHCVPRYVDLRRKVFSYKSIAFFSRQCASCSKFATNNEELQILQ